MRRLRRLSLVAFVGLTAASVGLAGLPRFQCRCPHGPSSPVALDVLPASSGCCCGGDCCAAHEGGHCCARSDAAPANPRPQPTGCCHAEPPPPSPPPAHCMGTLTQPEPLGPSSDRSAPPDEAPAAPLALPLPTVLPPLTPHVLPLVQSGRLPPPTDPVIAFCHLLI